MADTPNYDEIIQLMKHDIEHKKLKHMLDRKKKKNYKYSCQGKGNVEQISKLIKNDEDRVDEILFFYNGTKETPIYVLPILKILIRKTNSFGKSKWIYILSRIVDEKKIIIDYLYDVTYLDISKKWILFNVNDNDSRGTYLYSKDGSCEITIINKDNSYMIGCNSYFVHFVVGDEVMEFRVYDEYNMAFTIDKSTNTLKKSLFFFDTRECCMDIDKGINDMFDVILYIMCPIIEFSDNIILNQIVTIMGKIFKNFVEKKKIDSIIDKIIIGILVKKELC